MDEIEFHPEAEAEYHVALEWYQARSLDAADRFTTEVGRTLKAIAARPGMFPTCGKNHRIAMLKRFPFKIIYRLRPGSILITAIAHASRSSGYWRSRI